MATVGSMTYIQEYWNHLEMWDTVLNTGKLLIIDYHAFKKTKPF